ncbi:TonB-dependent receptor [Sphingomonas sp. MA1305]|uniref:TonB-dependent receptor n=1 Tax=Sphingomonas sp. MA1305 TaxID=2479204 RepID=UPI0018DF079E|nr:TonB-dependent receptor [Sphingomonas sp. MA1305]MBI0474122.1 TonB-dependent receptor [Sphingomonas sp. MA1305]
MRNNLFLGVAAVALIAPAAVSAQETTSAIRGSVTASGAPVAGATVTITNTTTNARINTATGPDGTFNASGLPVGGPYTVEIASPQGNRTVTDIYTVVQQPFSLPIDLTPAAGDEAGDIVVRASSIRGAGTTSDGPQTVLTQETISKVASVNRDIRDIQRRDPFATLDLSNSGDRGGAVSFAGVNPRYNRFTINGVTVGDTFGLNQDASPTNRGPVPFDAISQVSVSIAPYDFRQSGFQGGTIDTVLLSGTNEFHGTGFYSQNTDGLTGDRIGSSTQVTPKYKSETYGATLRGPLIADKLFFMVSAERNTDPRPFSTLLGSYANPTLLNSQINSVIGVANGRNLGANVGSVLTINPRKDEKITGRIDWNIMDGQRLSVSYINAYDSLVSQNNTSTNAANPTYGLSSNAYALTELLKAGIVQLNSDWTDKFSTEARAIYKYNLRGQEPLLGRGIGQLGVCADATSSGSTTGCSTGVPRIYFGPDNSRQTNQLFFDTWEGSLLGRYTAGQHQIQALVDVTQNRTFNNFVQNSLGTYYFDSLADFQAGNANQLIYAAPIPGVSAAADFRYTQFTFGMQDEWQVTDTLAVTYGARYSMYAQGERPVYNPYFNTRYGYPNTNTYNGLDQFEPRISFDWKPDNFLGGLKLRGGAGIFGGGSPDIYESNSFSNTITTSAITITRAAQGSNTCTSSITVPTDICTAALNNVTGNVPSSVAAFAANAAANPAAAANVARTNTGALSPNFHLPRSLKATISGDYRFQGFNLGADYYYSKVIDGVIFTDARSVPIGLLPDGRVRYGAATGTFADANYDIITGNSHQGHSHIIVVRASKDFDWGLSLSGSYTRQWVKDVGNATSSTINSNYRNQFFADPNVPSYGTSSDQIKWQFKYSVGYDHAFFGDYRTVFQLFGETRAGRPFSYTMQDNVSTRSTVFGTVLTGNTPTNLLYVPTGTGDAKVSYDSTTTQTALDAYINANPDLAKYRGQIIAKNTARNRAFTRIDLHVEQEIPTFLGKSRLSIFADINNLPNLLNKNWGGLRQFGFPYGASLVNVQCLSVATPTGTTPGTGVVNTSSSQPCAQYRYSSFASPNTKSLNFTQSLYQIRLGARFSF